MIHANGHRTDEPRRAASGRNTIAILVDAAADLLDANYSDEVLRRIAVRARALLTEDTAAVFLVEPDGRRLRAVGVEGPLADALKGEIVEVGRGIIGGIAETGSGEIINDTSRDPRGIQIEGTPATEANEKLMVAPIRSRGATIGIIAIWRGVGEPAFGAADMATLEGFSGLAAIAIGHAKAYDETQLRVARFATLTRIGQALVSTRDPAKLLETVYAQMSLIFDTTNFYIATYVQGEGEWSWELHYEGGVRQPVERHALGAGLTGHIITTRTPVFLRNMGEIRAFLEGQDVHGLGDLPQCWMGIPLIASDEVTGVMAIQNYSLPNLYGDADLEFFSLIGAEVAVALQNARLFKAAEEANDRLARTIEDLREAQEQLILQERRATLGDIVAGVAHEINTPIGNSLTVASFLEQREREFEDALSGGRRPDADGLGGFLRCCKEVASILLTNLRRAAELVSSFKEVAVDRDADRECVFDVRNYIGDVLVSLGPSFRKAGVSVESECPAGFVARGFPGDFSQILTNLAMNSLIHGFPPGRKGRVAIKVSETEGGLSLEYSDDGTGMPEDVVKRIFDPFFTTKHDKGCVGLGMNVVYNLVTQKLKGTIAVKSEVGRGMTCTIRIPVRRADRAIGE